jgi:hypothetical protein
MLVEEFVFRAHTVAHTQTSHTPHSLQFPTHHPRVFDPRYAADSSMKTLHTEVLWKTFVLFSRELSLPPAAAAGDEAAADVLERTLELG